jgi:hypothetical protein
MLALWTCSNWKTKLFVWNIHKKNDDEFGVSLGKLVEDGRIGKMNFREKFKMLVE